MFDDLETAESKAEERADPSASDRAQHWWIGRWAHVLAGVVFCALYFPLSQYVWSWQIAITATYIVFMLCCTFGIAFKDSDDLLGNTQVQRYIARLMLRQALVLSLISVAAFLWRLSKSVLPVWMTMEGRRMSLWDLFGIVLFYFVAVKEAVWMSTRIKQQLRTPDDPD